MLDERGTFSNFRICARSSTRPSATGSSELIYCTRTVPGSMYYCSTVHSITPGPNVSAMNIVLRVGRVGVQYFVHLRHCTGTKGKPYPPPCNVQRTRTHVIEVTYEYTYELVLQKTRSVLVHRTFHSGMVRVPPLLQYCTRTVRTARSYEYSTVLVPP